MEFSRFQLYGLPAPQVSPAERRGFVLHGWFSHPG